VKQNDEGENRAINTQHRLHPTGAADTVSAGG
jgi:hypothetical protein